MFLQFGGVSFSILELTRNQVWQLSVGGIQNWIQLNHVCTAFFSDKFGLAELSK